VAVTTSVSTVFTVAGNRLSLLESGQGRLNTLLSLIRDAKRSLRMLYYIYAADQAGTAVREALIEAAGRGVTVKLVVDGFGTAGFADDDFFQPVRDAGIELCRFTPRYGRRYLLRNHQKIALADGDGDGDGARVIVGGFNVEAHYFGDGADPERWRDLGLLVEGPAAGRLTRYFDELVRWTHDETASLRDLRRMIADRNEPDGAVHWLLGGPSRRLSPWARTVRRAIRDARVVDIIAAYFTPSPAMLRRMDRAGRRGRVRIVTAAHSDSNAAIAAARFTYAGLLRKGVKLFEYQPSKLHTKLYVIDDAVFIGSANLDMRSLFINMEIMLRIEDRSFADHLRGYVDREIGACEEITPELYRSRTGWLQRLRQFAAYAVIGIVDPRVSRGINFGAEG
jgi:cardiolipin synthase